MVIKTYSDMIFRRRYYKRAFLLILTFGVSFYISSLLFGSVLVPELLRLTDLHRCPACYGVSVCPELYTNKIIVDESTRLKSLFNVKNIHYGFTTFKRRVVIKKLAHNSEFSEFDQNLCKNWNLPGDCKPKQLLNISVNVDNKLVDVVKYNLTVTEVEPRKGLIMCPYAQSILVMLKPIIDKANLIPDMINIWTMLKINPEPIILQTIPKSKGWPVPAYGGVCGRLELVAFEGEPITNMAAQPWIDKLKVANQILQAALDFTFKHDRFRFYLMDWSLDNIVVDNTGKVTFVDLEDFVILDKQIYPQDNLPNWYQRYSHERIGSSFAFSIDNLCKHHLSDHNLWAACYILAGDDNGFLLPIPNDVKASKPDLQVLLDNCIHDNDRFRAIKTLQDAIFNLLTDEKFVKFEDLKPS